MAVQSIGTVFQVIIIVLVASRVQPFQVFDNGPSSPNFESYCWGDQYLSPGQTLCCNNPSVSFETVYLGGSVPWSSHWSLYYDCGCVGSESTFGTLAGVCCTTPYTNVNCTVCVTNTNEFWTHEWDVQASGPCNNKNSDWPNTSKDPMITVTNRIRISDGDSKIHSVPQFESEIEVVLFI